MSNTSKIPKESIRVASEPSKLVSGSPQARTKRAPELATGVDRKSSNVVLDCQFLEKVEAVRSVGPSDDSAIVEKQLTDKEKATLKVRLQQYEEALSNSPEDPTALEASDGMNFEVLRGLTKSLLAAKKPSEAVQVLLSFRAHLNDGSSDASEILTDANSKVELKTEMVDPVQVELLLGKAYADWGHVSDAVAVYDQLISKYPDDFRGYLAKGIILKENGKVGNAERMFIQAKFFAPEKAKTLVDRYSR